MKKIIISIALVLIIAIGGVYFYYQHALSPISNKKEEVTINIADGSSLTKIANVLKKNNLIRNEKIFLTYVKLNKINAKSGTYKFYKNYNVKKISEMINNGEVFESVYWITFIEGKTLKNYATQISKKANVTEKEVIDTLKDKEFINYLIDKYWFITDEILNTEIYFPLEGYLWPDTYQFNYDADVKTIAETMIKTLGKKLEPYKEKIESENLSVHKVLTLASIVEKEANSKEDRYLVAGVFKNRLDKNISLGSDVTTYYAEQVEMGSVPDLFKTQYNALNAYNTRNVNMIGLPVSPICNSDIAAIEAAINPRKTDYLFFYADNNGKVYYGITLSEHNQNKNKYGGK